MPNSANSSMMEGEPRKSVTVLLKTQKLDTVVECIGHLHHQNRPSLNFETPLIKDFAYKVPLLNILLRTSIVEFCIEVDEFINLHLLPQNFLLKFLLAITIMVIICFKRFVVASGKEKTVSFIIIIRYTPIN